MSEPIPTPIETDLAYTPPADVSPDVERPGLLRARTRPPETQGTARSLALHRCRVLDWTEGSVPAPGLLRHGFEAVDLSGRAGLLEVLARVRDAGHVRAEDAREIRQRLAGAVLGLGDGSRVRFLTIAPEGFIMRKAGPNGMSVHPPGAMSQMNGHEGAHGIHADQDVLGTPLRQMMRGAAPWLFRHEAPDSRNRWSPVLLLNLWIPLQQVTRPLVLMDQRSLDRSAQQLRYGLPTEAFLDRDESRRVNDIWTFLHDPAHRWYFASEMPLGQAYVFETLGTPHGSCVLPGEERAERRYRRLEAAIRALETGDEAAWAEAVAPLAEPEGGISTAPLRRAVAAMDALLDEARRGAGPGPRGSGAETWCARARQAMQAVVRKSLEMRVVAVRLPRLRRQVGSA